MQQVINNDDPGADLIQIQLNPTPPPIPGLRDLLPSQHPPLPLTLIHPPKTLLPPKLLQLHQHEICQTN